MNINIGLLKMFPEVSIISLTCLVFQQNDFDMLLVNLRMDAVNVKENMRISWASEAGLVENIAAIIKEYKDTRNLHVRAFSFKRQYLECTAC